jgi:UDP-N-acetylmuramyl tripeptide synthase
MNMVEKAFMDIGFDADAFEKIADEGDAIERALSIAKKNDLVCIMSGRVEQVMEHLNAFHDKEG